MTRSGFVHLRVHSAYSLSEGALKIKELVQLARTMRMPAVAVTDTGNLFGALEFALAAVEYGIQPIIGTILAVSPAVDERKRAGSPELRTHTPDQLVLLVQDEIGYQALMRLVSRAFLETEPGLPPQVTYGMLAEQSLGLIALTGGIGGGIGRLLASGQNIEAGALLERLQGIFPGRLYIELQRHMTGAVGEAEARIEEGLIRLAYEHDIPLVATNDCLFATPSMYEAHDALLCIAEGRYVSEEDRRRVTPNHAFLSADEMRTLFADLPEAIDNTIIIAQRCGFLLQKIDPILPPFITSNGASEAEELTRQAEEGLRRRLSQQLFPSHPPNPEGPQEQPYWERLHYELSVIIGMRFPGYFLIVSDFMKWARGRGIPVGVRGSGATSVVAWALDITSLDPLRFRLLFERFLNPERLSMPDFDIDFCQERREEVINYVREKYGRDRVAQIITFGKLQARAVVRDVGRVMQIPYSQVDRITKLIPNNPAKPVTLAQAIKSEPALAELREKDEAIARMLDVAQQLEGLYRHASTHAAGVVIADRPLDALVPLYRDPNQDMPVTQFSMKYVEQAGLVKFDFLGLKTLTVIARALGLLGHTNAAAAISATTYDDPATYRMLSRGDSTGVFQLESAGMRDLLRRMQPDRIEHLIALVALYRPGPMDSIPTYIACRHGEAQPRYLHPDLEPILSETFGVMTYQEDVMMIAQKLAGYTLGGADYLRWAMGKKIKEVMDKEQPRFVDGCVQNGISSAIATEIFEQAAKFAGYGFNKGHAAAYAQLAYQTAYLKANYPVEFMAALMTLDLGNTDKINILRQELARINIELLPPDINKSDVEFTVQKTVTGQPAIRYALAAVKGVGQAAMKCLTDERAAHGAYRDLDDFTRRVDSRIISRKLVENLARAGAFDSINRNRRQIFESAPALIRQAQTATDSRHTGQTSLFASGITDMGANSPHSVDDWDPLERLNHEFDSLGFYLSAHPLDRFRRPLERMGIVWANAVARQAINSRTTRFLMAGQIISRQERSARSGNRFAFLQLSDPSGVFEVMIFSEILGQSRALLENGYQVLLSVDAQLTGDTARLSANRVQSLEEALTGAAKGVGVIVKNSTPITGLRAVLGQAKPGTQSIDVIVPLNNGQEATVTLPARYALTTAIRARINDLDGVVEVVDA